MLKLSVSLRCLVNNIYSEILFHPVHCLRVNKSRYENVPLHFLRLQHSTSSVYLLIDCSNMCKTNAVVISMIWFVIDYITFTSNYNTIDEFVPPTFPKRYWRWYNEICIDVIWDKWNISVFIDIHLNNISYKLN